jgi:hypothetical protein
VLVKKAAKISKTRGDKIPQQNRIQAPPNWQWEMRTNQPTSNPNKNSPQNCKLPLMK